MYDWYNPWTMCAYCGGPLGKYGCANCDDDAPRDADEACDDDESDE